MDETEYYLDSISLHGIALLLSVSIQMIELFWIFDFSDISILHAYINSCTNHTFLHSMTFSEQNVMQIRPNLHINLIEIPRKFHEVPPNGSWETLVDLSAPTTTDVP